MNRWHQFTLSGSALGIPLEERCNSFVLWRRLSARALDAGAWEPDSELSGRRKISGVLLSIPVISALGEADTGGSLGLAGYVQAHWETLSQGYKEREKEKDTRCLPIEHKQLQAH